METNIGIFEEQLKRYVVLYYLLGLIERDIRSRAISTLSNLARQNGYIEWIPVLPNSEQNRETLFKALRKNRGMTEGFESYSPFSFWKNLFKGGNYVSLWLTALHYVFPYIHEPLSKRSFDQVCTKVYLAAQIRNRVAHYTSKGSGTYEKEKAILMWLIRAMHGPAPIALAKAQGFVEF